MNKKLTISQVKALNILEATSFSKPYSARGFARAMWGETNENLFTKVSNQGNGACHGKAAWLCGGSYLGKLAKKGWVKVAYNPSRYYISEKGKEMLASLIIVSKEAK